MTGTLTGRDRYRDCEGASALGREVKESPKRFSQV
jgi:hypothetical protein